MVARSPQRGMQAPAAGSARPAVEMANVMRLRRSDKLDATAIVVTISQSQGHATLGSPLSSGPEKTDADFMLTTAGLPYMRFACGWMTDMRPAGGRDD